MCGIFGLVEKGTMDLNDKMRTMSRSILHRGPDDQNWVTRSAYGRSLGFGIDRLSIIDLRGGRQPITNEDGTVEVVFNGEIYNYTALRAELEGQSHVFKTRCDTEVLVHLYEQHGYSFLHKLRGMFAFCIFDRKDKKLFIARDHAGIKPLYYHHSGNRFAFGSEIRTITSVYSGMALNPSAIASYFTYRYIPGPETIYKGILALPPAHYMVLDLRRNTLDMKRWWTLNQLPVQDSYQDAKAKVRHLLTQAVRRRLQSEVPLGAFLSGGVDSSVLCAVVAKELGTEINVYNVGYAGANEYDYAGRVSRDLGFNYYQCGMTFEDMVDVLPDVIEHMGQPLSDAACFPTLFLSRVVKKGCTVMLSGEGADEIFAGYWQYDAILKARTAGDMGQSSMMDHLNRSSYFMDQRKVVSSNVIKRANPLVAAAEHWGSKTTNSLLSCVTGFDTKTWLPDDLLMKVDKMTMAASVEARVPFLDIDLMEYAFQLPDHYKYQNGTTKRILKDVAEDLGVPKDITRRPKMGFTVPIDGLLRGSYKDRFLQTLHSSKFRSLGDILNMPKIDYIVHQFYAGQNEHTLFCWTLFMFAIWLDTQT